MPPGATRGRNTSVRRYIQATQALLVDTSHHGVRANGPGAGVGSRRHGAAAQRDPVAWRLPNLPGAACQGHHELYEDVAREDPVTSGPAGGGGREVVPWLPATGRLHRPVIPSQGGNCGREDMSLRR